MNTRTLSDFAARHQSMNEIFRPENIPPAILEAIERYRDLGIRPGDCTYSILCNDLFLAVARADEDTLRAIPANVAFITLKVPIGAHGSREVVDAWIATGRHSREASQR